MSQVRDIDGCGLLGVCGRRPGGDGSAVGVMRGVCEGVKRMRGVEVSMRECDEGDKRMKGAMWGDERRGNGGGGEKGGVGG